MNLLETDKQKCYTIGMDWRGLLYHCHVLKDPNLEMRRVFWCDIYGPQSGNYLRQQVLG